MVLQLGKYIHDPLSNGIMIYKSLSFWLFLPNIWYKSQRHNCQNKLFLLRKNSVKSDNLTDMKSIKVMTCNVIQKD